MKIEKLKFGNINSLAGDFEVDFTHPELAVPGIFVITGPTGSGKTSILDSIAFALYGKSPRQRGVSKSSNELMSHGTSQCYAEVQFAQGGEHYIARAEQKRARRGANPFSEARYELWHLTDDGQKEMLTNSKREYDRLVPIYTGLSFSNFSRCMMLAQGDFAVFLKANESERADVLSTITGTDIYMRIGEVVHERVAAIDRQIQELKLLPTMATEERAHKEKLRDDALAELKDTTTRLSHVQNCLAWLKERQTRAAAADAAAQKSAQATLAWQGFAQGSAADLQQAESALSAQPAQTAMLQFAQQLQSLTTDKEKQESTLSDLQQKHAEQKKVVETVRAIHTQQLNDLQEKLKKVREEMRPQETKFNIMRENAQKLAKALELGNADLEKAADKLAKIAGNINKVEQSETAHKAELEQLKRDMPIDGEKLPLLQARLLDWQQHPGAAKQKELPAAEQIAADLAAAQQQIQPAEEKVERLRNILELKRRQLSIEDQLAALYVDFCEGRLDSCPCCGATMPGNRRVMLNDDVQAAEKAVSSAATGLQNCKRLVTERESLLRLAELRAAFCKVLTDCGMVAVQNYAAAADIVKRLTDHRKTVEGLQKKLEKQKEELTRLRSDFEAQKARVHELTRATGQAVQQAQHAAGEYKKFAAEFVAQWGSLATADQLEERYTEQIQELQDLIDNEEKKLQKLFMKENSAAAALKVLSDKLAETGELYRNSQLEWAEKLSAAGFADEAAYETARQFLPKLEELRAERDRLKEELAGATALFEREKKAYAEHLATNPTQEGDSTENLLPVAEGLLSLQNQQQELLNTLQVALQADDVARRANKQVEEQEKALRAERARHDLLKQVLGDKKEGFKQFAQQITFDMLLRKANIELRNLSERYELRRNPQKDNGLGLMVVDRELGIDEGRDCSNLSGGESFIISLALALGLSRMAGTTRIDSLFLDEGFGTLDRDTLSHVLHSLQKLRADGKMVGIISHVESLSDRISARIQVQPLRGGFSTLTGTAAVRKVEY